jgi:hypothetical protein
MTAAEFAELRCLAQEEVIGEDRADSRIVKSTLNLLASWAGKEIPKHNIEALAASLLPNPPPPKEQTTDEAFHALFSYSQQHNAKWQRSPSEP